MPKRKADRELDPEVYGRVTRRGGPGFWDADYPSTEGTGPITFSGGVHPAYVNTRPRQAARQESPPGSDPNEPSLASSPPRTPAQDDQGPHQGSGSHQDAEIARLSEDDVNRASMPPPLSRPASRTPVLSWQRSRLDRGPLAAAREPRHTSAMSSRGTPVDPFGPPRSSSVSLPHYLSRTPTQDMEDVSRDTQMRERDDEEQTRSSPQGPLGGSLSVQHDPNTQPGDLSDRLDVEVRVFRPTGNSRYNYHKALSFGAVAVAALAHTQATQMGSPLTRSMTVTDFRIVGMHILWSMPLPLLRVLAEGNVAERSRVDPVLIDLFASDSEWMLESEQSAPIIYVLALVDDEGLSPNGDELREVLSSLQRYVSSDASFDITAEAIDTALGRGRSTRIHNSVGLRRFICKMKSGGSTLIRARVEIVKQFCESLRQRLDTLERAGLCLVPLQRPLMYVGYAFSYSQRMSEHDSGETSFLMQLVRSVCIVRFGSRFDLESFPVAFLAEETEASLAELLITQIANSFSWTGGGLNIHPPGINNASAEMRGYDLNIIRRFWVDRQEFRKSAGFWNMSRARESDDISARATAPEGTTTDLEGNQPPQRYQGNQKRKVEVLDRLVAAAKESLQDAHEACQQRIANGLAGIVSLLSDPPSSMQDADVVDCQQVFAEFKKMADSVDDTDIIDEVHLAGAATSAQVVTAACSEVTQEATPAGAATPAEVVAAADHQEAAHNSPGGEKSQKPIVIPSSSSGEFVFSDDQ